MWIEQEALEIGAPSVAVARPLERGERLAVRIDSDVAIGRPGLASRPVPDAALGAVVARFEGSGVFAWPERPLVWTAPEAGRLVFGINAYGAHEPRGRARVVVVRLGPPGSEARRAFPPPSIEVERVRHGVVARYADRAGFGIVPSTLRLTIRTRRGPVYDLAAWAPTGERETFLPLPPPGIDLPPGVHKLSATIEDWIGNTAPPATIVFDSP